MQTYRYHLPILFSLIEFQILIKLASEISHKSSTLQSWSELLAPLVNSQRSL